MEIIRLAIIAVFVGILAWWLYKLLRLRQQIGAYREYWSQEHGGKGGLLYLALGDSAAQGIGASSPEKSYVSLVADYISEQTGKEVRVINLSKTGAKLVDILKDQLPKLSNLNPDIVTVDIGGNDIRGFAEEKYRAEIEELCRLLPKNTLISDIPYFMHGNAEVNAGKASCFLTDQANENGLIVVELHQSLKDRGWKAMLTDFAPDWFHPNDSGYRVWFDSYKTGVDIRLNELKLSSKTP